MKIPLKNLDGAYLKVSPDLKTVCLWRTNYVSTYGGSSEYLVRELDEFESDFVISTISAMTVSHQSFFEND